MWDLHSNSKAWQGCCPQTHGKTGSPPLESALPPPYPYSPFVHGAEGKHSQPLWVCPAALEHHFLLHDESLVRQGTKGPLSKKLLTWTSMHPHEVFFLFSSLGEQSSLPDSSIRTYWTSQKRSTWLKNEKKREKEKENLPSFWFRSVDWVWASPTHPARMKTELRRPLQREELKMLPGTEDEITAITIAGSTNLC